MCRVVLSHLAEGVDVDIKECAEELEDDAVGCEGDSAVDDIVTFVDVFSSRRGRAFADNDEAF